MADVSKMCPHCDSALAEGARYCSTCGASVTQDGESTYESAKTFVLNSAGEAERAARDLLENEDAQKIAGAAVLGGLAAIVLPVSVMTGAVVGAGIMAYNRFVK